MGKTGLQARNVSKTQTKNLVLGENSLGQPKEGLWGLQE